MFGIQGDRKRENPLPIIEKRNTIMILTKKKYEWSAIKSIELVIHFSLFGFRYLNLL